MDYDCPIHRKALLGFSVWSIYKPPLKIKGYSSKGKPLVREYLKKNNLPIKHYPMNITLNGESRELPTSLTIAGLLAHLEVPSGKVAVECNLAIVPSAQYATHNIEDGDRIEIVHFIGGG